MEPSRITCSFVRIRQRGSKTSPPIVLDVLHALQFWRVAHLGREFRLVRSSPFRAAEQLHARLLHLESDLLARAELDLWCKDHMLQAVVLAPSDGMTSR